MTVKEMEARCAQAHRLFPLSQNRDSEKFPTISGKDTAEAFYWELRIGRAGRCLAGCRRKGRLLLLLLLLWLRYATQPQRQDLCTL